MRDLVTFRTFKGINNIESPWELKPDELQTATNIDITKAGRLKRRNGRDKVINGNFHSMFSTPWIWLAVKDDDLVMVNPDLTLTTLRYDVGNNEMSYAVANDTVGYTNGMVVGYVRDKTSYLFPDPTDEFKLPVVPGDLIEAFNNRFFISVNNVILWTDVLSQRFGCIDKRRNGRQLPSRVLLLKAVDDGLYLSDEEVIYFAKGSDPYEMILIQVLNYPVIEGMVCEVDIKLLPLQGVSGKCFAIGTEKGVCFAMNGGNIFNATEKYYEFPDVKKGAMLFRQGSLNQVIASVNY